MSSIRPVVYEVSSPLSAGARLARTHSQIASIPNSVSSPIRLNCPCHQSSFACQAGRVTHDRTRTGREYKGIGIRRHAFHLRRDKRVTAEVGVLSEFSTKASFNASSTGGVVMSGSKVQSSARMRPRVAAILVSLVIGFVPNWVLAIDYSMEFWSADQISFKAAPVIQGFALPTINHPDYYVLAEPARYTGGFSIADSALGTPDAFISLASTDFLSFNLTIQDAHFDLPGDPLRLCGYVIACQPEDNRLGVRLDPDGMVQRFDNPVYFASNSDSIIDTDYDISNSIILHPQLVLWDQDPQSSYWGYFALDDAGDWVVIPPDTASNLGWLQLGAGPSGDDLITPLGHTYLRQLVHSWSTFNWPGASPAGSRCATCAWFMISPSSGGTVSVPEPSTVVLFGSALVSLFTWQRWASKRRCQDEY